MHDDPADRVPACVSVPTFIASTGTNIEGYFYSTPGDAWAVALNGSSAEDVPSTARVNCRVDWHGALGTVKRKEPSVAATCCKDPHVSLIHNPEMCIAVLFDK